MRIRTPDELLNSIKSDMQAAGIQSGSPTGIIETLQRGIARVVSDLYRDTADGIDQSLLSKASGQYLDDIGRMFGVARKSSKPAFSETSQIVYVDTGTFRKLSNGEPILIPYRTVITSADGRFSVQVLTETEDVTGGVLLDPNRSQQAIPIRSLSEDPTEIIPANSLTRMPSPYSLLKTRNTTSLRARIVESDTNYRFRIYQKIRAEATSSESAIRFGVLSIPGVSNVILRPYSRGAGSMDVLVVGVSGRPSAGVLNLAEATCQRYSPTSLFTIRGVNTVLLSVRVAGNLSDSNAIGSRFQEYIDSLAPGQPFNFYDFKRGLPDILSFEATVDGVVTKDQIITINQNSIFLPDKTAGSPVTILQA